MMTMLNSNNGKMKKKKTNLLLLEMSVEEFIGEVCRQIELIREHHFTWKSQANFLKELNPDLKENEVLILLNFVENYSFVVYDAVQCYHWNNSQATLHLFIVHYLNANIPVLNFFCVISDKMKHYNTAVHEFMSVILPQIKQILPNLIKCYYFSDGAGSHYKNYKNFADLCHYKADFGVDAGWNFFATSHVMWVCVSLQMLSGQTSTSSNEMFNWCKEKISDISFTYVSAEDVKKHSRLIGLEKCYKSASTVPGIYKIPSLFHTN